MTSLRPLEPAVEGAKAVLLGTAWDGIAELGEKALRRRAKEPIAIVNPDFLAELRKEAQKLSWPWDRWYAVASSSLWHLAASDYQFPRDYTLVPVIPLQYVHR
jgi:hypothetical protein